MCSSKIGDVLNIIHICLQNRTNDSTRTLFRAWWRSLRRQGDLLAISLVQRYLSVVQQDLQGNGWFHKHSLRLTIWTSSSHLSHESLGRLIDVYVVLG